MVPRAALVVLALLIARPCAVAAEALAEDDAGLLEGLVPTPLIDPRGAVWVQVTVPVRTMWCEVKPIARRGWMPARQQTDPVRVRFADGEEATVAPDQPQPVAIDFVASTEALLERL